MTIESASEIIEARDFQGVIVDCRSCVHGEAGRMARCGRGQACVNDRYARRIDRFFSWNPALADLYLAHPHFEVRAVAANYASVFRLPALLGDTDETVRWNAARRLPKRFLVSLRNDPHREVRIRVASQLSDADLAPMMRDSDYYVRVIVARRIVASALSQMIDDPETEVRRVVANRIVEECLGRMARDKDAAVRLDVARRLPSARLSAMLGDPDWRVRYYVAGHVDSVVLVALVDDVDPLVRELARDRLSRTRPAQRDHDVIAFGCVGGGRPPSQAIAERKG